MCRCLPGSVRGRQRIRPGVKSSPLVEKFRKTFPYPMARDWNRDASAIPRQQDLVGDIRGRLIILLCSVGIVLLIACANVASLLLRAPRRAARKSPCASLWEQAGCGSFANC